MRTRGRANEAAHDPDHLLDHGGTDAVRRARYGHRHSWIKNQSVFSGRRFFDAPDACNDRQNMV